MESSPRFKNQLAKLRPRSAPWLGMFRSRKNAKHYHVTELPCKKCVCKSGPLQSRLEKEPVAQPLEGSTLRQGVKCHCEKRSDEAIPLVRTICQSRLLRFARDDKKKISEFQGRLTSTTSNQLDYYRCYFALLTAISIYYFSYLSLLFNFIVFLLTHIARRANPTPWFPAHPPITRRDVWDGFEKRDLHKIVRHGKARGARLFSILRPKAVCSERYRKWLSADQRNFSTSSQLHISSLVRAYAGTSRQFRGSHGYFPAVQCGKRL